MFDSELPLEMPESLWRTEKGPIKLYEFADLGIKQIQDLLNHGGGVLVTQDWEAFVVQEEVLTKLPHPTLDAKFVKIAQLLASIHTLARESVGANLTDHKHFTLDEVRREMIQCVEHFFEEEVTA